MYFDSGLSYRIISERGGGTRGYSMFVDESEPQHNFGNGVGVYILMDS